MATVSFGDVIEARLFVVDGGSAPTGDMQWGTLYRSDWQL
jgi:hypothetical protein